MKEDVTEFDELKEILGYTDERSVIKWCKTNNIPVLKMGFKKYILSHYLTQYIDNQLVIFEKAKPELKVVRYSVKKKSYAHSDTYNEYLSKFESIKKSKAA
jgi:hypothetical protein